MEGKRAIVVIASGGVPRGSPMDHASTYMTTMLGFIRITDVTFVAAEGTAGDLDAALKGAQTQIVALTTKYSKKTRGKVTSLPLKLLTLSPPQPNSSSTSGSISPSGPCYIKDRPPSARRAHGGIFVFRIVMIQSSPPLPI